MRFKPLVLAALIISPAVALSSAGCTGVKRPYTAASDPYQPGQVQIADKRLERKLAFQTPSVSRDEADLLYVSFPVRAATSRSQLVNYRFTFFDNTGRELPGGDAWQTAKLQSNLFDNLQGNSTSPRAADFRLDLKTAE